MYNYSCQFLKNFNLVTKKLKKGAEPIFGGWFQLVRKFVENF